MFMIAAGIHIILLRTDGGTKLMEALPLSTYKVKPSIPQTEFLLTISQTECFCLGNGAVDRI